MIVDYAKSSSSCSTSSLVVHNNLSVFTQLIMFTMFTLFTEICTLNSVSITAVCIPLICVAIMPALANVIF